MDAITYDRQLLLHGAKRNSMLELWEVERYGEQSYGNRDYVSIYGLRPADWYAKGIRLLGRTAVECTRDELADAIGADVAAIARAAGAARSLVIDPFAGSGNSLYWMLRRLPHARGLGCELDPMVFHLTAHNLKTLQLAVRVLHCDYLEALAKERVGTADLVVVFVAPPWGKALSASEGLDLRLTTPPIPEIVERIQTMFSDKRLLCAIQVYEVVERESLAEVKARFDWSALRIYGFNAPGQNHGIVLATKGWVPE
jgi:16S rRNA G966 N2-methylase RsmD